MVALKAREVDRFLSAPPSGVRLFLLYGNDAGAITERARAIERTALVRGGGDLAIRFGSELISAEPGRIAEEAYSASLFGGEPVISLRIQDGRHNVLGAVEPLLAKPPEAAWLIVEAGELSKSSALLKAFEASRHAVAAPSYQADAGDLSALITATAETAEIVIEPDAMETLVSLLGADRMASRRELEKLFLYVGDARLVTRADVEQVVGETTEVRNDDLIDAALLGDSEALELGMDRLRGEGGSPSGLAAQALRHFIMLQGLRAAMDGGASIGQAMSLARPPVFPRRAPAIDASLRRWPADALVDARRRIADAISLARRQPGLETAAVSQALHTIALEARRLRAKR
jgi:DNA polymerase-3 subunit delta